MGVFDDLIPEYTAESSPLLHTIEAGLLQVESGEEEEAAQTIFRAIHSIRGGAALLGLTKIERLARRMEDLLRLICNGDLEPVQPVTDALLQSLDVLASLFARMEEHQSIDIEGPIRALEAALNAAVDPEIKKDFRKVDLATSPAGLPDFELSAYSLKGKLDQGNLYYLHLDLGRLEARGLTPVHLVQEMLSVGEILDSRLNLPATSPPPGRDQGISFDILYYTVLEEDLLQAALRLDGGEVHLLGPQDLGLADPAETEPAPAPAQMQPAATPPEPRPQPAPSAPPAPPAPPASPSPPAPPSPPSPPPAAVATSLPEESPPESPVGEYLTFTLGEENYGVDILSAREIMALPRLTRLPRSPRYLLGVMNLRGMVVPVMDLRLRLGLPARTDSEPVVMVLKVNDKYLGVVVDAVTDVIEVKESQVQEPPDFAGPVDREHLRGLYRHQGRLIVLLELDQLLSFKGQADAA